MVECWTLVVVCRVVIIINNKKLHTCLRADPVSQSRKVSVLRCFIALMLLLLLLMVVVEVRMMMMMMMKMRTMRMMLTVVGDRRRGALSSR